MQKVSSHHVTCIYMYVNCACIIVGASIYMYMYMYMYLYTFYLLNDPFYSMEKDFSVTTVCACFLLQSVYVQ